MDTTGSRLSSTSTSMLTALLWLGLEQVIVWTNDLSASDLTCYCYSIHLRSVAFYAPNSHIMIDCGWLVGCWLVTFVTYVWLNNAS